MHEPDLTETVQKRAVRKRTATVPKRQRVSLWITADDKRRLSAINEARETTGLTKAILWSMHRGIEYFEDLSPERKRVI